MIAGSSISATQAAPGFPGDPGVKNAIIKHLSTNNESIVFEVNVDNEKGEKFSVIIKGDGGATLYRGVFSDKNFSKKFVLPKADDQKLVFQVKSASGVKSEAFEVNSSTRLVEEVIVTKL